MATPEVEKIGRGVTEAVNRANRVRTTPKLARLARLPGTQKDLTDLIAYGRKVRNRLQDMERETEKHFAGIVEAKTAEYKRWGMTEGEKPGMWTDNIGVEARVNARDKAIASAKKSHVRSTEHECTTLMTTMRAVAKDLDRCEPLFHSTTAMLLRETMGSKDRANYMTILQGAGPVAIQNAVLDAVMGDGNKALGAAIVTLLEKSKTLQKAVSYSREDIADALVSDDYWQAFESLGLMRYFIEQCEVSVLSMEGSGVSTQRKMRAGILKAALEKETAKLFNEAGDTVDQEGNVLSPQQGKPKSDDYYAEILAESRARDAAVAKEKRRQAAKTRKESEDEVARITTRTEAEENALYGGAS